MTYKEIVKKKEYFQNITWIHLSNCLKAFENRELLSASIWSAVFVESMLKDILSVLLNVNISTEEISSLIARLRNILNNGSSKYELSATDATVIEDIISTITPHTFEQSEFIEEFCSKLKSIGIKPVRCVMTDFDRRNPMEKVRRYIEGCHGIIVLGLERSHAYFYRDKEGSEKELEATHRRYSSAWLQLGTGMAIGMGKDVFVLCQKNLYGDGIFDRNWNSYTPVELEMPLDMNDPMIKETLSVLENYKKEVEAKM